MERATPTAMRTKPRVVLPEHIVKRQMPPVIPQQVRKPPAAIVRNVPKEMARQYARKIEGLIPRGKLEETRNAARIVAAGGGSNAIAQRDIVSDPQQSKETISMKITLQRRPRILTINMTTDLKNIRNPENSTEIMLTDPSGKAIKGEYMIKKGNRITYA